MACILTRVQPSGFTDEHPYPPWQAGPGRRGARDGFPRLRTRRHFWREYASNVRGHPPSPARQGPKQHADPVVGTIEVIFGDGPVPAPALSSGAQPQQPPSVLLVVGDHVGEVLHHPLQIVTVDVREKVRLEGPVRRVVQDAPGPFRQVLNGALLVQNEERDVGRKRRQVRRPRRDAAATPFNLAEQECCQQVAHSARRVPIFLPGKVTRKVPRRTLFGLDVHVAGLFTDREELELDPKGNPVRPLNPERRLRFPDLGRIDRFEGEGLCVFVRGVLGECLLEVPVELFEGPIGG